MPTWQSKRSSAPGLGSLGVLNFVSVGFGVRGLIGSKMEALFVLITDRRGLGDDHPKHHSSYRKPRYY